MAIQNPTAETYKCPECAAALTVEVGSWTCSDCRYVPRHSAD